MEEKISYKDLYSSVNLIGGTNTYLCPVLSK